MSPMEQSTSQSEKTPRVLHIITRLDSGGAATNTLATIYGVQDGGFETALLYGKTASEGNSLLVKELAEQGIGVHYIPSMVREISLVQDLMALNSILNVVKRGAFDLIHTHSSKAGVLGRLAAAMCRLPCIHTPHGHVFYGYFHPLLTRVFITVERLLARITKRIVSLTDLETSDSLMHGIGKEDQYVTIPSGVALHHFHRRDPKKASEFRRRMEIPDEALLFISVGRLVPIKGFDILLRAFAEASFVDDTFLAVVGAGQERESLLQLSQDLGIQHRVRFIGHMEDIRPALGAADIFAMMSRNEGMGRVFIEAMAASLPVIAPSVGGIPSFLEHAKTGILVAPGKVEEASSAMARLASDPGLCRELVRNAQRHVVPTYSQENMVKRIIDMYRETLNTG